MNRLSVLALVFMATCTFQAQAQTQNVYRCGNSYSQTPCPGGKAVDTADSRSEAQKAQADRATQRDLRTADRMEQARLKQEESQRRSLNAATQAQDKKNVTKEKKVAPPQRYSKKNRVNNPAYFAAKAADEKKKKKQGE